MFGIDLDKALLTALGQYLLLGVPCPELIQTNLQDILMTINQLLWDICSQGIFLYSKKVGINPSCANIKCITLVC